MKHTTIKAALERVADKPHMSTDDMLSLPVHELVCRTLFEIANSPTASERGSMTRANTARTLIFNRMVGRRRTATAPAVRNETAISIEDLTGAEIEA